MKDGSESTERARSLMEGLRWNSRPLLLFEPENKDSSGTPAQWTKLRRQVAAETEALEERDMVVIRVTGESGSLGDRELPPETAAALCTLFGVNQGTYEAILVGKDGGTKLRRTGGTELREIFQLVDSMPMRRAEMTRRRS